MMKAIVLYITYQAKGMVLMSISREDVHHIALLARMRLTEDEITELTQQLSSILGHIAVLQEVDVSSVAASPTILPQGVVLAADDSQPSLPLEDLLANAPQHEDAYLRVKGVFE